MCIRDSSYSERPKRRIHHHYIERLAAQIDETQSLQSILYKQTPLVSRFFCLSEFAERMTQPYFGLLPAFLLLCSK
ncbi:hypothetical protein D3C72_2224110 [compost metagenome]